ncbi:MAG: trypsin-like peptidase domain-containing protein [Bdellovibrio sp.]|nr:trypsin-like peptidase domain-containing protein [Bdellovibrio sp.]
MKWISLSDGLLFVLTLTFFVGCGPENTIKKANYNDDTKLSANVIYGTDGRLDVYQTTDDRLKRLADSTVALIRNSDLQASGGGVSIAGKNYGTDLNLCATEKFREQDTAAFCSGSLVGSDLILTAGHCVETLTDCQNMSVVFGFAVKTLGALPKTANASEVYRCKEIIKTVKTSAADFAVIKLDRVVTGHAVLPIRATGDVEQSTSLVVIGHPVGLPTKITTGGVVRSISTDYFTTNLDTFGGNSGSAVFNSTTGFIEGILVRGEQDFESKGSCVVSKVCAEGACRGEDVTKISVARAFIPAISSPPIVVPPVTPPVIASELFSSNSVVAIPDNNVAGIASRLQVTSSVLGRKVIVSVNITHTYIGDLVIKVIAADGTTAVLHQRAGGSAKNLLKSYEVTSSLGKVNVAGVYKLTVQDLAGQDIGNLVSWSVQLK